MVIAEKQKNFTLKMSHTGIQALFVSCQHRRFPGEISTEIAKGCYTGKRFLRCKISEKQSPFPPGILNG